MADEAEKESEDDEVEGVCEWGVFEEDGGEEGEGGGGEDEGAEAAGDCLVGAGVGDEFLFAEGFAGDECVDVVDFDGEEEEDAEEELAPRKRRRRARKPKPRKPKAVAPAPVATPAKPKPPAKPSIELPSSASIVAPTLPSDVDTSDIRAIIRAKSVGFKRCLEKSAKAGEKLKGTAYVHMTVNRYGKAEQCNIKDPGLDRSVLGRCVVDKLSGGGYPPAENGPMTITFPLRFVRPD